MYAPFGRESASNSSFRYASPVNDITAKSRNSLATKKALYDNKLKKAPRARGITAQVNNSLRRATAAFSILLTCAWLTPTFSLISFWVLPSK